MSREKYASLSKFISLILRHQPEIAGITLDANGWANVDDLIEGVNRARRLDIDILREIVATDGKGRYSLSEDGTKIRANQGHSVDVDAELEELEPPEILYHGTCMEVTDSINAEGLKPMTRLYVHLSDDYGQAMKNGRRKGDHKHPVVYRVKAGEMFRDGHKFYRSANGVWQAKFIPPQYLEQQGQQRNAEQEYHG
ncbi:MAG: RNA 2'-phosphotransferase [Synergistaceae bacterium]|nr:RNA 2'-phosphotransferase [Synergistaceae bacterium]MBR0151525.1 RNA 2'-phosphotransferase [Synergistaceae bacterium]